MQVTDEIYELINDLRNNAEVYNNYFSGPSDFGEYDNSPLKTRLFYNMREFVACLLQVSKVAADHPAFRVDFNIAYTIVEIDSCYQMFAYLKITEANIE